MRNGKVWLLGAGPGDPELLTLKAVRALGEADVVLMDDLVNREMLRHARPGARVIEIGKRGGCKSTPQAYIEKVMVRFARRGAIVARLKGGDPFVFGRGGEEVEALEAGFPADTPACAIRSGTLETQTEVVTTLGALPAAAAPLGSPAILVIGEVVRHARASAVTSERRAA